MILEALAVDCLIDLFGFRFGIGKVDREIMLHFSLPFHPLPPSLGWVELELGVSVCGPASNIINWAPPAATGKGWATFDGWSTSILESLNGGFVCLGFAGSLKIMHWDLVQCSFCGSFVGWWKKEVQAAGGWVSNSKEEAGFLIPFKATNHSNEKYKPHGYQLIRISLWSEKEIEKLSSEMREFIRKKYAQVSHRSHRHSGIWWPSIYCLSKH